MVLHLAKEPSQRLLKHVVRCYSRLSDNPRQLFPLICLISVVRNVQLWSRSRIVHFFPFASKKSIFLFSNFCLQIINIFQSAAGITTVFTGSAEGRNFYAGPCRWQIDQALAETTFEKYRYIQFECSVFLKDITGNSIAIQTVLSFNHFESIECYFQVFLWALERNIEAFQGYSRAINLEDVFVQSGFSYANCMLLIDEPYSNFFPMQLLLFVIKNMDLYILIIMNGFIKKLYD